MPNLERVNGEQIRESGWKYQQQTRELNKQIHSLTEHLDKTEADRYLEEYRSKVEI
jgi:hypothetical protein